MSKKPEKVSSKKLQDLALNLIKSNPKKVYNAKRVKRALGISNNSHSIEFALDQLVDAGELVTKGNYKYMIKPASGKQQAYQNDAPINGALSAEGYVDMTRNGAAFIVNKERASDIFVSRTKLNGATDGDLVEVAIYPDTLRKKRQEGHITKVLSRATEHYMGTYHTQKKYGVVHAETAPFTKDIRVDFKDSMDAEDQDKVVVKVLKWPVKANDAPLGKITSKLGKLGSNDLEMKSILISKGFDDEFPEEVTKEAEQVPMTLVEADYMNRRDIRETLTFTIDPVDAKDFDDAISFQELENGDIEIGVHIADVTHYLKEGTAMDREARRRSTSVYLVDRVAPMLPEKLSNNLCSLVPNEDRLAFSAIFTFDKEHTIKTRWFGKTIIHSDQRFSYEDAQEALDSNKPPYGSVLQTVNDIAHSLRAKRFKNGSINFETDEVRFKLDDDGKPIEIYIKERQDTNLLIEDLMLLANKEVATYIDEKGKKSSQIPFVYRIHDTPNQEKLGDFARFAALFGIKMDFSTPDKTAKSFNKLVKDSADNPDLKILMPLGIRCMAKAVYSTDNIGHYGLGFKDYCHFTSPIRRYADVLVHRILERNLFGSYRMNQEELESLCTYISNQEKKAVVAERESIKLKQVEYITAFKGKELDGIIMGISERGFFVELVDSYVEGMVSFNSLEDEYVVEEGRMTMRNNTTNALLRIGDHVKVRVEDTDMAKRQVDFTLIEKETL